LFPYIPNTPKDIEEMLSTLGLTSVDQLFEDIPENIRLNHLLNLEFPKSEAEVSKIIREKAKKNLSTDDLTCYLGAGAYDHAIPSIVHHLTDRSEFNTAYTPYQPEVSQGTLQVIFEFQSMIASLTGMDVANASMYDGATAAAEAAMLAAKNQKGNTLLLSKTVNLETRKVIKTYMHFNHIKVIDIPEKDGTTDLAFLESAISKDVVGVVMQSPNFWGNIESCEKAVELAHDNQALMIMSVDPISLAILKTPGDYGADIAVGDGQVLGNSLNFGGPYLGFMAAKEKHLRKLPGRIVGQTVDLDGKRAFTLTLQAREQHIRRDKATSNICSNQALNALAATIYLSALGKEGLKDVARQCVKKSYYAYEQMIKTGKFAAVYEKPFFREFVLETDIDIDLLNQELLKHKILGGLNVNRYFDYHKNRVLISVTEKRTKVEIDYLIKVLEAIEW